MQMLETACLKRQAVFVKIKIEKQWFIISGFKWEETDIFTSQIEKNG